MLNWFKRNKRKVVVPASAGAADSGYNPLLDINNPASPLHAIVNAAHYDYGPVALDFPAVDCGAAGVDIPCCDAGGDCSGF